MATTARTPGSSDGRPAVEEMAPVSEDLRRRRERVRRTVDVTAGRGLEIGALSAPLVTRTVADVRYVDVQSTAELQEHYRGDPAVIPEQLVEVDCPLYSGGRLRSIAEATADVGPFDWAVASHVVEHVPDLIGWLADLAEVLVDDGRLALVVPDRRYSFDARRPATSLGGMVEAHEARHQRPSLRAVFDHHWDAVSVTTQDAWRGVRPGPEARIHDIPYVRSRLELFRTTDQYIDCHVWVFTPAELVGQLRDLAALGLLEFVVEEVQTTQVGELEFHLTLRRLPRSAGPEQRALWFAEGFDCPPDAVEPAPPEVELPSEPELPAGLQLEPITPRELAMVLVKRRLFGSLRLLARRLWRLRA